MRTFLYVSLSIAPHLRGLFYAYLTLPYTKIPQVASLLGERYAQGYGVVKRPDLAQCWFEMAAAQPQPDALLLLARLAAPANAGSAEAELWLGMAYLSGEQVSADPALGRYWLELVAGHCAHEAEYQLSLQQVDQDQQLHWLTLAADGCVRRSLSWQSYSISKGL